MEVTLNAGDLLYFPRGTIHEGRTDEEAHSLHITVSVYQHNSYADLLEHVLPAALKKAAAEDLEFRKGLPLNFLKHTGHVNRKAKSQKRSAIKANVQKLMKSLSKHVDIDQAADQLGRKFMYDSLPPVLSKQEVNYTSKYDGDFMKDGKVFNRVEIGMDTEVRLVRYHCLRLVMEGDIPKIYYNTENAKVYHGEEEQVLTIDRNMIPCVKKLQNSYPKFIQVEDLLGEDSLAKAQLVSDFWERGLLVTNGPLLSVSEEENEEADKMSESSLSDYSFDL
nr:ribosomal oxygenase 1-like [Leptinotarsa decemlineata]